MKIITSIGYRLDFRNHTANSAVGRNWTDVTLKVSETDITGLTGWLDWEASVVRYN